MGFGDGDLPETGASATAADCARFFYTGHRKPAEPRDWGSSVSIRFLDCAPMQPWWPRWDVGGTTIVVETDQGMVLVDTGVGLHDHKHPNWIVRLFTLVFGLRRDPDTTAVRQLARRGIAPSPSGTSC